MTLAQIITRHPSLQRRWIPLIRASTNFPHRNFSTQTETETENSSKHQDEIDLKVMSQRYHKQRTLYKKQVSLLRKQYAEEISAQKELARAQKAKEREEIVRRKQERQRLKNLRSIENAKRDLAEKAARAKEFELELIETQKRRDVRNGLFRKARLLFLKELEEESVHWMITPEEVEEKLGGWETEQLLWSHPHLIGAAPEDATFWRFQAHTQPRHNRLMSPREHILEKLEEKLILEANLNPDFWTPERRRNAAQWQEKAKLRALVQNHGRSILLKKQRQMLQDEYLSNAPALPKQEKFQRGIIRPRKKIPAPSLAILANDEAQEEEGVKFLMNNPSKFFVFEEDVTTSPTSPTTAAADSDTIDTNETGGILDDTSSLESESSVRGKPVSLLHEFGPKGNAEPYPLMLAKEPKDDNRTEKEKKRAQKEDERLAKQRESMDLEKGGVDFEHESGPLAVNEWDEDDYAWEEEMMRRYGGNNRKDGKPGITLEELKKIPMEYRLMDEDIDWITEKLQSRLKSFKAGMESPEDDDLEREANKVLNQVGIIMSKLSEAQKDALTNLDIAEILEDESVEEQEIMKEIQTCIGSDTLSKDDIRDVITIERKLMRDDTLRKKLTQ